MAQTALFISPMARKKRVSDKYQPNSYRVISQQAEPIGYERPAKLPPIQPMAEVNILGQGMSQNPPAGEFRHNRPNPGHVNFLRQDVKLLNEPVCDVYTRETLQEQSSWWPHRSPPTPTAPLQPPHTLDTTVRDDFQYRGQHVKSNTRHSSNPNKEPALGSAPVNFMRKRDGKQRFWKEGLSYEHQYNSRLDPQYPIRGKRHGAFVWDEFPPHEVTRMLKHYGYISDKVLQTSGSPTSSKPGSGKSNKENVEKNPKDSATEEAPPASITNASHGEASKVKASSGQDSYVEERPSDNSNTPVAL